MLVSLHTCPHVSTSSRSIRLFNKNWDVNWVALPFKNVYSQLIYKCIILHYFTWRNGNSYFSLSKNKTKRNKTKNLVFMLISVMVPPGYQAMLSFSLLFHYFTIIKGIPIKHQNYCFLYRLYSQLDQLCTEITPSKNLYFFALSLRWASFSEHTFF